MLFYNFPSVSPRLINNLHALLADADRFAYDNVTHNAAGESLLDDFGNPVSGAMPRGGPFGAVLAISLPDGSVSTVAPMRGNNVLASGIASQHAEDRAMQPDAIEELIRRLLLYKLERRGEGSPIVWMISSAQSCPTCQTKQEILARQLIERDLIAPGHFMTLFGATYDETYEVAGLNDACYADALILACEDPCHEGNLVRCCPLDFADAPAPVQKLLARSLEQRAVVWRDGAVYAQSVDQRAPHDPFSTAEVSALRAACRRHRSEGEKASWLVDGALYTTTRRIGPLALTEASWTGMNMIYSVQMPPALAGLQRETQEAPGLSNAAFLAHVAHGYQDQESVMRVFRDMGFQNRAQKMWRRILKINNEVLYNGSAVSSDVLRHHDEMRFSFAPFALEDIMCASSALCLPLALKPWVEIR